MGRLHSQPFAQVPEWLLDADVSDRAVRLFGVLLRYADADRAWPGRPKLAARLRCSTDSIDRAVAELVEVKAVVTEPHFRPDGSRTSNSYYLWPASAPVQGGSRTDAEGVAAGLPMGGRTDAEAIGTDSQGTDSQGGTDTNVGEATDPDFERFWQAYRRRGVKVEARRVWAAAVKAAGSAQVIIDAAERYSTDPNLPEPQYVPHAKRWLTGQRWEHLPLPPRAQQRGARQPQRIDTDRSRPSEVLVL